VGNQSSAYRGDGRRPVVPTTGEAAAVCRAASHRSDLEFVMEQIAALPTRGGPARPALGIIFGAAGPVIAWLELFWRGCL
jgi:hypothetical protein